MKLQEKYKPTMYVRLSFGYNVGISFNSMEPKKIFLLAQKIVKQFEAEMEYIKPKIQNKVFRLEARMQGSLFNNHNGHSRSKRIYGLEPVEAYEYFMCCYRNYPEGNGLVIYENKPKKVLRFQINQLSQDGKKIVKGKVITVDYCPLSEGLAWFKNVFKDMEATVTLKVLEKPVPVLITVYEAIGAVTLKRKSFNMHGLTCLEIYDYVMNNLSTKKGNHEII